MQNEKMRMLRCEGVQFRRDGQMAVSDDAVWKFGDAGRDADGDGE